mgnify:CR=1 FL=1
MRCRPLILAVLCSTGCAGPERGFVAEFRGRTQALYDLAEARTAGGEQPFCVPLFPLLYAERGWRGSYCELFWPLFETGRSPWLEPEPSRHFRIRPLLYVDSFRRYSRVAVFPVYFHIREKLEAGNRSIDHLWPLYGLHREWIDLAPATTHHFFYPLIFFRNGWSRWKIHLFPILDVSSGYYDHGWWLLPVLKSGGHGQSRFFYLLDPLFAYERDSIAETEEDETREKVRWSWKIFGGLVGWENDRGKRSVRLFWLRAPLKGVSAR